jgi:hypothetical protein
MVALPLRHGRGEGADMTRTFAATFAALLLAATPAYAGGKGGGTTAPPAPDVDPCEAYWALPEIVNRTLGGCVVVRPTTPLSLDFVTVLPGWSYTVDSSGGSDGRVQVSFENASTGQRAQIRVEPGKTVIR